MIEQLKNQIDFHQSQWNRLRINFPEQASFHRGAVMAFSKSIRVYEQHVTEQAVQADALKGRETVTIACDTCGQPFEATCD